MEELLFTAYVLLLPLIPINEFGEFLYCFKTLPNLFDQKAMVGQKKGIYTPMGHEACLSTAYAIISVFILGNQKKSANSPPPKKNLQKSVTSAKLYYPMYIHTHCSPMRHPKKERPSFMRHPKKDHLETVPTSQGYLGSVSTFAPSLYCFTSL